MNVRSLSRDELLVLLSAARAKRERDWLMILVAFRHGLRATEVVSLTRDNFADGYLAVQRLKGSNRTVQALAEHENQLLNERQPLLDYILKLNRNQRLFWVTRQRFWQLVREHGTAAGIPRHKLFPHALKHTIALLSIKLVGVENVRQYLGHRSLSSTGAYLKVNDAEAAAAVDAALRS